MAVVAALFATVAWVAPGPATSGQAAAQGGFQAIVQVNGSGPYTRGVTFEPEFSPPLPEGWSWENAPRCTQFVMDNAVRPISQVGSGTLDVPVGSYQLRQCSLSPFFQVLDEQGNPQPFTAVDVVDGTYRVFKAQTELQVEVTDLGDGDMVVEAVVLNSEQEDTSINNAQVDWAYQGENGVYQLDACRITTEWVDPGDPSLGAIGACILPAQPILAGTGNWQASFRGTGNYEGANAQGWISGALTSYDQAAYRLTLLDGVQIVPEFVPPGCYREAEPNASLIGISLAVVSQNCTALQVLEVLTEIFTTFVSGPGQGGSLAVVKAARNIQRIRIDKWVKSIKTAVQNNANRRRLAGTVWDPKAIYNLPPRLGPVGLTAQEAAGAAVDPLATALTPNALAVDDDGYVYVADHANYVVRRISPDGTSSEIVVGNGLPGVPVAGPALETPISNPTGLAVGDDGVVYVADGGSHAILAVEDGVVRIVAGMPRASDGPAVPPPLTGPATASGLFSPSGLALDEEGNLYTALAFPAVVVKITPAGQLSIVAGVPTVFGRPSPGNPATQSHLFVPTDVAIGPQGDLFIADSENFVVGRVGADGLLSIAAGTGRYGEPYFGGDGPLVSDLGAVTGVAADADGNLYLADPEHDYVYKADAQGGFSVLAGTGEPGAPTPGPATESALGEPTSLAVDAAGNVYITDTENRVVLKVDGDGVLSVFAGNGQKVPTEPPAIVNLPEVLPPGGVYLAHVGALSDGPSSLVSSTPDVCTVGELGRDGIPVTLLAEGSCTLVPSIDEGTSWLAAEGEPQTFRVEPLRCGGEPVTVDLGEGDAPTGDADVIRGTPGADVVDGGGGDDLFCGRGGADTFEGGSGDDRAYGNPGRDVLRGGSGEDLLWGGIGADALYGEGAADALHGGRGRDHLDGGPGADDLDGGTQRDVCRVAPGGDAAVSCEVRRG